MAEISFGRVASFRGGRLMQGRTFNLAMLLAVLVGTSACSGYQHYRTPLVEEISGVWVHHESDAAEAKIDLRSDGSLQASGLPSNLFNDSGNSPLDLINLVNCEGNWSVGAGDETAYGANPYLDINLDSCSDGEGAQTYLLVRGEGTGIELYRFIGDGDNGIRFVFKPAGSRIDRGRVHTQSNERMGQVIRPERRSPGGQVV